MKMKFITVIGRIIIEVIENKCSKHNVNFAHMFFESLPILSNLCYSIHVKHITLNLSGLPLACSAQCQKWLQISFIQNVSSLHSFLAATYVMRKNLVSTFLRLLLAP